MPAREVLVGMEDAEEIVARLTEVRASVDGLLRCCSCSSSAAPTSCRFDDFGVRRWISAHLWIAQDAGAQGARPHMGSGGGRIGRRRRGICGGPAS